MRTKGKVILVVVLFIILMVPLSLVIRSCNLAGKMADNAFDTAYEEFKPSELLRKYEWFKNTLASLDRKKADVKIMEARIKSMEETYGDTKRKDWPRDDRESYNLKQSELVGIKMSYNSLAAEYNAQMAKLNWRFTNAGDLPKGSTKVLPREVREYITE